MVEAEEGGVFMSERGQGLSIPQDLRWRVLGGGDGDGEEGRRWLLVSHCSTSAAGGRAGSAD